MAIIKKLKELFDEAKVSYEVYNHPLAYTAQEIAQRQHFSGDQMAKVVILKVDGKLVMAIITGSQKIHLPTVRTSLGVDEVKLGDGRRIHFQIPRLRDRRDAAVRKFIWAAGLCGSCRNQRRIDLLQLGKPRPNGSDSLQGFRKTGDPTGCSVDRGKEKARSLDPGGTSLTGWGRIYRTSVAPSWW